MTGSDTIVWQGRFLEMHVAPHGSSGRWEYVKRTRGVQAAVILALTDARDVVLVEQYRAPLDRVCIEFPAGLIGDEQQGEDGLASAKRELIEETGFQAQTWEAIGSFASSPGMVGEEFLFYRATGLTKVGPGGGVDGENITVHVVPLEKVADFLMSARQRGIAVDTRLLMLLKLV